MVTVPADSVVETVTITPNGAQTVVREQFPAGTQKREIVEQGVKQDLGGTYEDVGRAITAKLGALKWVQYVGIALMLGAASMFHPIVRVAVGGGKQMQMAIGVIGLGLVFGPVLLVGNEKLLFIVGGLALAFLYLFSRLSYKEAQADSLKGKQ